MKKNTKKKSWWSFASFVKKEIVFHSNFLSPDHILYFYALSGYKPGLIFLYYKIQIKGENNDFS